MKGANNIYAVAYGFKLNGNIKDIRPFGEGHINSTFLVETDKDKYILQKINHNIFKNIDDLMNNIQVVTSFISSKGKESMKVVATKEDKLYLKEGKDYYRVLDFVKDTECYQEVGSNLELVRSEGEAFGELHYLLSDLDASLIKEVIPDFHNTEKRFLNFLKAKESASTDKLESAKMEIEYIENHEYTYSRIYDEIRKNNIKTRIIHNDTKINNVLFDKKTGLYRCVIDLDTVMPGSVLFDIGDAFRSLFTGDNEDNKDTSLLKVNFEVFKAFISGYLSKMKNELSKTEIELIPFSIYLMTIECGIRFLEDYLRGNVYFHVAYEEHNLIRAKTQIALADNVLNNIKELNRIVEDLINE